MHFFSNYKNKKRLKISCLRLILNVLSALIITACSQTPQNSSTNSNPAVIHHDSPATSINSVLNTTDSAPNPQLDRLYTGDAGTLWERVRKGYQLNNKIEQPLIDDAVKWYRNNPTFVYRTSERS